ncbi:hypothetical protein [Prauserella flavalba]|uniref:hypothetical protein n=1 Tax=Prauserella flavalba TaxID=1477506 RepID=UPI0036E32393
MEAGLARTLHDADGTLLYSIAPTDGLGYHLTCRSCRRQAPISVDLVENWATSTAHEHAFTDIHVIVEITGQCDACPASDRANAKNPTS